ncbi:MAG: ATP-binding protein [Gammaproteobacteria bacterium]|nr:GHKL domain-containing protein [Pseudomonadales bacterium]MCP5345665.1 GHKL domain-containing protein [Pseudomonadales bacterium]
MAIESKAATYSIQNRLLTGFSLLLALFLGLTGVVLDRAFRDSVEAGAAEQLQLQIYVVLGAIDEEGGEFFLLEDLREPRFAQLNSGLYSFVSSPQQGELWRSASALDLRLTDPDVLRLQVPVGESVFTTTTSEDGEELFLLSYGILWEDGVSEYNFSVLETAVPFYSEISEFRTSLWSWLGGVALLLLILQVVFLRWGLSPLHRMARDLKSIEAGESEALQGTYPKELIGVTDNLNLLIKSERKQQARYRTTLGDLAHSLKTPLAVITGVTEKLSRDKASGLPGETVRQIETVEEQLERMNQIIGYQLQRAVQANGGSALGRRVKVGTVVTRILAALDKVYAGKGIQHQENIDENAVFSGDERDLMEILGNVLDNAYKYGHSKVRVCVQVISAGREQLSLVVEDDGPGVAAEQRHFILQRGARADTLAQGQGIGLAVVTDIVASYGGLIDVNNSELGGTRIQIAFENTA